MPAFAARSRRSTWVVAAIGSPTTRNATRRVVAASRMPLPSSTSARETFRIGLSTSRPTASGYAPPSPEVYNSAKTTSAARASSNPRRVMPFSSCSPSPMKRSSPIGAVSKLGCLYLFDGRVDVDAGRGEDGLALTTLPGNARKSLTELRASPRRASVERRGATGPGRGDPSHAHGARSPDAASPHRPSGGSHPAPDNGAAGDRPPDGGTGIRIRLRGHPELQGPRRGAGSPSRIAAQLVRRDRRHRRDEDPGRTPSGPGGDRWCNPPMESADPGRHGRSGGQRRPSG